MGAWSHSIGGGGNCPNRTTYFHDSVKSSTVICGLSVVMKYAKPFENRILQVSRNEIQDKNNIIESKGG